MSKPESETAPDADDPSSVTRTDVHVAYTLGMAAGRTAGLMEAASAIRDMAAQRKRSDVNAIAAATALLDLATASAR